MKILFDNSYIFFVIHWKCMFLLKYVKKQTNKFGYRQFSSAIENFYNLCRNPYENYGIFIILGGYDKGFNGIHLFLIVLSIICF